MLIGEIQEKRILQKQKEGSYSFVGRLKNGYRISIMVRERWMDEQQSWSSMNMNNS